MNANLHEALYEAFLMANIGFVVYCFIFIILLSFWKPITARLKRFVVWAAQKLGGMISRAQKRRRQRRAASKFYTENIPGTNGYRIKTR